MDIDVKPHAGFTLVSLRGRVVDGEPAVALQKTLKALVRDEIVNTVIDLEDVTWFDSIGVGLLISHYISVQPRGGRVLLLNADEKIRHIIKMVHLDDRFGWPRDLAEVEKLLEGTS